MSKSSKEEIDYWKDLIKEYLDSGSSLLNFSQSKGIKSSKLQYWQKKLRPDSIKRRKAKKSFPFIEVKPRAQSSFCRITMKSGIVLDLHSVPDPHWLNELDRGYDAS